MMKLETGVQTLSRLSLVSFGGFMLNRLLSHLHAPFWNDHVFTTLNWEFEEHMGQALNLFVIPGVLKREAYEVAKEMFDVTYGEYLTLSKEADRLDRTPFFFTYFNMSSIRIFHASDLPTFFNEVWKHLYFKPTGELDLQEMGRQALKRAIQSNQHLIVYYQIACRFCLEDMVVNIYQKLSPRQKLLVWDEKSYWSKHVSLCGRKYRLREGAKNAIVMSHLEGAMSVLYRPRSTISYVGRFLVQYLWDKLNSKNKQILAERTFKFALGYKLCVLLCSTIPYLEQGNLQSIVDSYSVPVLNCLLNELYFEKFLLILRYFWDYMCNYSRALAFIHVLKKRENRFCKNLQFLLEEIWPMCTVDVKRMILGMEPTCKDLLLRLLPTHTEEIRSCENKNDSVKITVQLLISSLMHGS